MKKIDLIAVVGPTASGKSAVAIDIAKRLNSEIINCDSMQIYKEMNIGTAKITENEMEGIPHHLLSIRSVDESYSVAEYSKDAKNAIEEIKAKGRVPIIVGGTGLYIDSVVNGITFTDEKTDDIKEKYLSILENEGADFLHALLCEVDLKSAQEIHKNNTKRVVRALVATEAAGKPFSLQKKENIGADVIYNTLYIGLDFNDRDMLYKRINDRVDIMIEQGLLLEAQNLYGKSLSQTALAAIGYKELFSHFSGEISYERALELIRQRSRNYAKRQLTWFRRNKEIHWFNPLNSDFKDEIYKLLRENDL